MSPIPFSLASRERIARRPSQVVLGVGNGTPFPVQPLSKEKHELFVTLKQALVETMTWLIYKMG